MVYAPYGRAGVYMLQEFCRRIGLHANDTDIRELIAALESLPPGIPCRACSLRLQTFEMKPPSPTRYSIPSRIVLLSPPIV